MNHLRIRDFDNDYFRLKSYFSEKCGLFGVYGRGLDVARLTYFGLFALQHRGQESSGMASSEGNGIRYFRGRGLVAQVYDNDHLDLLRGHIAIGHNRYSTSGGPSCEHAQPIIDKGGLLALAHNGNLPSTLKLEKFFERKKINVQSCNDSELMHHAITYFVQKKKCSIQTAIKKSLPLFTGVYSLLMMTKNKLIAVRDSRGIRPLSLGKLNGSYVVSSETCALDTIGAKFVRDIRPGEMLVIDKNGTKSHQIIRGGQKLDIFEMVYFSRPDSILLGKKVNEIRRNLGVELAKESPIKADVVIPVPDSAIPAALGYSRQSNIPFDHGLIKNRYIHRTFIQPSQEIRENDVLIKLNPVSEVLKGKDVIIIDDSIVRGTTSKILVELVRKAGAKRVHILISSPPIKYPDFYGMNTPYQDGLIASKMPVKKIAELIGADSLKYLSYKGLIKATGLPESKFSTSCFTGKYPVDIGERAKEVKRSVYP